jgi:antitoxin (DNA-binding transcriptional repressor) of toxin-antitoxin stability system
LLNSVVSKWLILNLLQAVCGKLLSFIETGGFDRHIFAYSPSSLPYILVSIVMAKPVIHISEIEAANNFASLLARVRAGAEVVIEQDKLPVAVIHAPAPPRRTISECIALAKVHEEETGEVPIMDAEFAADMEEIIKNREVWNPPTWE